MLIMVIDHAVQEVNYAVDNFCHTFGFVAAGIDERVHPGGCTAYSPGHRHHCYPGSGSSGTKDNLTIY
jgi:hypothetical protein